MITRLWLILPLVALPAAPLAAQSPTALLGLGIQAYRDLDMEDATRLLRRSLEDGPAALEAEGRKQALSYLAAAEVYRDRRDSAVAAFRVLVDLDPRYRPDPVAFPPDVVGLFDEVRKQTPAIAVSAPSRATVAAGEAGLPLVLYASVRHTVVVTTETVLGKVLETVHKGPVADSLMLHWKAPSRSKAPPSGGMVIGVTSLDRRGRAVRRVDLPVQVVRGAAERLEPPPPPALLPERQGWAKPVGRLTVGLGLAALSLLTVPAITDSDAAGVATGLVFTAAGVIGFVEAKPGRPLPENVAANAVARARWRAQADAIQRVNRARADGPALVIEVGEPTVRH